MTYEIVKMDFKEEFQSLVFRLKSQQEIWITLPSKESHFRLDGRVVGQKTIYTSWDEENEILVYLHINSEEEGFSVYITPEYVSEMPHYGWGNSAEEAYAEAMKSMLDMPNGYVQHEQEFQEYLEDVI